jgi:DUF4097 and DUF4098 domain-containing protein YvlB
VPTTHHTFATPEPITLELHNDRGTVDIVAGDTAETTVSVTSRHDHEVCRVEHDEASGRVTVEPVGRLRPHRPRLAITVHVPTGSRLSIAAASASVDVRGQVGETRVDNASGSITIDHVEGHTEATSASGGIRIGTADGTLRFRSASGSLRLDRVTGACEAQCASGSIAIGTAEQSLSAKSVSGSVRVGEVRSGTVELRSTSGSVHVGVRRGTLVWLDVASVSGRVASHLDGGSSEPGDGETPVELHLRSVSGSISIGSVGTAAAVG